MTLILLCLLCLATLIHGKDLRFQSGEIQLNRESDPIVEPRSRSSGSARRLGYPRETGWGKSLGDITKYDIVETPLYQEPLFRDPRPYLLSIGFTANEVDRWLALKKRN